MYLQRRTRSVNPRILPESGLRLIIIGCQRRVSCRGALSLSATGSAASTPLCKLKCSGKCSEPHDHTDLGKQAIRRQPTKTRQQIRWRWRWKRQAKVILSIVAGSLAPRTALGLNHPLWHCQNCRIGQTQQNWAGKSFRRPSGCGKSAETSDTLCSMGIRSDTSGVGQARRIARRHCAGCRPCSVPQFIYVSRGVQGTQAGKGQMSG